MRAAGTTLCVDVVFPGEVGYGEKEGAVLSVALSDSELDIPFCSWTPEVDREVVYELWGVEWGGIPCYVFYTPI